MAVRPLRILAAAAVLALGACGSQTDLAAFTDSRPPAALPVRAYSPEGWTWGLLQVGEAPPVRYGVGAPARASRGAVVIVPDAGEPAEAWFAAANVLIAQDWSVWVLDLQGQGGSARAAGPRDMRHVNDFAADAEALRALLERVVRPEEDRPAVVLASGVGAAIALDALSRGPTVASGAVLLDPLTRYAEGQEPGSPETARWMRRLGFGDGFAHGQSGWTSRPDPAAPPSADPARAAAAREWMRANPDLRSGGVSWSWVAAFDSLSERVRTPAVLQRVGTPVLVLASGSNRRAVPGAARALCDALPRCTLQPADAAATTAAALAFAEALRPRDAAPVATEPSRR